jgi:hypothetical protein
VTSDRRLGIVTAIGRPEYDYLHAAALSVAALNRLVSVEWSVCTDGPAVDRDAVAAAVASAGAEASIVCSAERRYAGPCRNRALAQISAPYLVTLDADDTLCPDGVIELLDGLSSNPEAAWAAGRCHQVDPSGLLVWEGPEDSFPPGLIPTTDTFWHAKQRTGALPFICTATVAKTDAIRIAGGWPEPARRRADDTALWAVVSTQFVGLWVPALVYRYRRHEASTTNQPGFRAIDERLDQTADMVRRGTTRGYAEPDEEPTA